MPQKYTISKNRIFKKINELAKKYGKHEIIDYTKQILETAIKLYFDGADQADLKLINKSFKELRYAFKIFSKYRGVRKVTIWGSSRVKPGDPLYKCALEFSKKISKKGFMVITGGGGGIMEAGNRGAGNRGFGVNIHLPMEPTPNPFVRGKKLLSFHYFFTRKLIFVKESDATVLFPGGFGTNDEGFEILTLAQTGKTAPRPIVLFERKGCRYWSKWLKFLKEGMLNNGFISKDDFKLFTVTHSVDEAVEQVTSFYKVYHSLRYVGPLTVIRLNKTISKKKLLELNNEFKDILTQGEIEMSPPRPEEIKDRDNLKLPRLAMYFNRINYGRFYEFIRKINEG